MTVAELRLLLGRCDSNALVFREVNGDVTRTGDFLETYGVDTLNVYPVSYGGYENAEDGRASDEEKRGIMPVIVIR